MEEIVATGRREKVEEAVWKKEQRGRWVLQDSQQTKRNARRNRLGQYNTIVAQEAHARNDLRHLSPFLLPFNPLFI